MKMTVTIAVTLIGGDTIENKEVTDLTVLSEEEDDDEEEVNGDFERGESIDEESVIALSFLLDDDDAFEPSNDSDESSSEMTFRFSSLKNHLILYLCQIFEQIFFVILH